MIVTELRNGFDVAFDYNPRIISAIKSLPPDQRRFNMSTKSWFVGAGMRSELERIVARFNGQFGITADRSPEIVGEIPELPEPSDAIKLFAQNQLKLTPYNYQFQGIEQGTIFRRYINGDDMGLGKTLQSIATVLNTNSFPCLVVCPTTLKENWKREWSEKFSNKKAAVMNDSIKATWPAFLRAGMVDVFIVNYESLKKYFVQSITTEKGKKLKLADIKFRAEVGMFKSIIFDEIHKCKDGDSQQSKFSMGIAAGKEVRIGLTGTPIVNKTKDLIPLLFIIGRLDEFGGYKQFIARYCDGGKGSSNLKELQYKLHTTCFFRRLKKDVLKDLPDRMRQIMLCDITNRGDYNKAKNDFVNYLKDVKKCTDKEINKKLRGQFMVQLGILKGISARGKINSVIEWVDEIVDAGEKVILFCTLREIGDTILNHYGAKALQIRGGMSMEERSNNVHKFQMCKKCGIRHEDHNNADHDYENNQFQIILCSIKAAGTGLTLTASSRVGFIEFPWTDADCDQCESRAHRNGQKESVLCGYFLGEKTIDSWCYELIKNKRTLAQAVAGQSDVEENVIDEMLNLFKD